MNAANSLIFENRKQHNHHKQQLIKNDTTEKDRVELKAKVGTFSLTSVAPLVNILHKISTTIRSYVKIKVSKEEDLFKDKILYAPFH